MRCLRDAPRHFQAAGESACGGPARKASGPRLRRREIRRDVRVAARTQDGHLAVALRDEEEAGGVVARARRPSQLDGVARAVVTFATLGFVPSCSAMPRAARAAAASSKAASRSADPAGTTPRRTTYIVMSLGASPVDSAGSTTQERSVRATDSRRMACSPLLASLGTDRRARRAVFRDAPRRAIPPTSGDGSGHRQGDEDGRTGGRTACHPSRLRQCARFTGACVLHISEAARRIGDSAPGRPSAGLAHPLNRRGGSALGLLARRRVESFQRRPLRRPRRGRRSDGRGRLDVWHARRRQSLSGGGEGEGRTRGREIELWTW